MEPYLGYSSVDRKVGIELMTYSGFGYPATAAQTVVIVAVKVEVGVSLPALGRLWRRCRRGGRRSPTLPRRRRPPSTS